MKRQKIGNIIEKPMPTVEVHSGKQLRQLLAFDQDPARSKSCELFTHISVPLTDPHSYSIFQDVP